MSKPVVSQRRLDATAAVRALAHALVANDADDAALARVAALVRDALSLIEDAPRRQRRIPDFTQLSAQLASGLTSPRDAMADRAVSGSANPTAVQIEPRREGDEVYAEVHFGPAFVGAPGRVHGGIVAAVFDDVTGFILPVVRRPGFTARLTVDFLAPVPVEETIQFRAAPRTMDGRKLWVDAEARLGERILARAEALFVTVDPQHFATHAGDLLARDDRSSAAGSGPVSGS